MPNMQVCPAGWSSDEDDEDDYGFSFAEPILKPKFELNDEEKFIKDLQAASIIGDLECVEKLFINSNKNVDICAKGVWSPLMLACSGAHSGLVKYFLENGANVNFEVDLFTPALTLCSSSGRNETEILKCFELLQGHGANFRAIGKHRMTSLMYASKEGHLEVVKRLCDEVNIDYLDSQGWSALFWAVFENQIEIVEFLVQRKAKINIRDVKSRTACDLAISKGFLTIADIIGVNKKSIDYASKVQEGEKDKKNVFEYLLLELSGAKTFHFDLFNRDIEPILNQKGLKSLIPLFKSKEITFCSFLTLRESDLDSLGVQFPYQKQMLMNTLLMFHTRKWSKSSLQFKNEEFSIIDAVMSVTNIVRHLSVLNCTLKYLKEFLPEIMKSLPKEEQESIQIDMAQKSRDIEAVIGQMKRNLKAIKKQGNYLEEFYKVIPADLIEGKVQHNNYRIFKYVCMISVVTCVMYWKFRYNR